jgi:hypothetical protein
MKIVFSFVDGSLADRVFAGDADARTREGNLNTAAHYYKISDDGRLGNCFCVPTPDGRDEYEVVRRQETTDCVFIRAHFRQSLQEGE